MKSSSTTATKPSSGLYPGDPFVMSASHKFTEPGRPPPAYTARDSRATNNRENWPLNDSPAVIPVRRIFSLPSRPSLSTMYNNSLSALITAFLHAIAAVITLVVSIPAIDFYADQHRQLQGNGNRGYGAGGSVLAMIWALLSISLIVYAQLTDKAIIVKSILVCLYSLSGALIGYSTYLVRHDTYCDPRYVYNPCMPVHYTTGWRCGIATVSMCGFIVLVETLGFIRVFVKFVIGRLRTRSNRENSAV